MTFSFSILVMLLNFIAIIFLIYRIGILKPASIFSIVVFLYGHAFILDYIIWPSNIHYPAFKLFQIDPYSTSFFYANLSYFSFLIPFVVLSVYLDKKSINDSISKKLNFEKFNFLYNLILITSVILLYVYLVNTFGLTRTEKNDLITPTLATILATITYFWVWVIFDKKEKGILFFSFTSLVIIFFIYSFEREPILLVFLMFLFFRKNIQLKDWYLFIILLILLVLWKSFFTMVIPGKTSLGFYFTFIQSIQFSFSSLDPLCSFALLVDFFNDPEVYQDYRFSYITNLYGQFYRMFFDSTYQTLSEYTSMYFAYSTFGLAFSMLVESFLNMWLLGPTVLGFLLAKILAYFTNKSKNMGNAILVIATMISIKFIRTELTTLIKLQLLPAVLSYLLYSFSKKKVRLPSFYSKT